jgi:hypothetical protein
MTLSFLTSRARGDHVFRLGVIKRTNLVLFAPPPQFSLGGRPRSEYRSIVSLRAPTLFPANLRVP